MTRQLRLLEAPEPEWHLDDETRRVGLAGVAEARRALASSRPQPRADDESAAA
jgi:hypothetical protein